MIGKRRIDNYKSIDYLSNNLKIILFCVHRERINEDSLIPLSIKVDNNRTDSRNNQSRIH